MFCKLDSGSEGRGFESHPGHRFKNQCFRHLSRISFIDLRLLFCSLLLKIATFVSQLFRNCFAIVSQLFRKKRIRIWQHLKQKCRSNGKTGLLI